jgi:CrcB protein
MYKWLMVGSGGFVGALLRYWISGFIQNVTRSVAFPYGTLAVNIAGCYFIGLLAQLVESQAGITAEMRLLLMVGLLGAFTTYSTFGSETLNLLQNQRFVLAILNVGLHLVLGLSAVLLGRFTIITLWR